jgi:hypothetical protein
MYTLAMCTLYIIIRKILSRLRLHAAFASIPGPESQGWKKMGTWPEIESMYDVSLNFYSRKSEPTLFTSLARLSVLP